MGGSKAWLGPYASMCRGGWYHITSRGQRRGRIYYDTRDRIEFLSRVEEMATRCGVENPNEDQGNNGPLLGGPCPGSGAGLCTWAFNPVSMNIFIWNTPLWYQPALGPAVEFTMSYNLIDAENNPRSFGSKWFLNYQ